MSCETENLTDKNGDEDVNEKTRTVALGLVFLVFLALAYVENISFFHYMKDAFSNPPIAVALIFIHNVLAVSMIILGMSFYVGFTLTFLPKRKYEYVVLQHPRLFALIFTLMILAVSILRAGTIMGKSLFINTLTFALVILISAPNGIIEGYGIYQSIMKTLKKSLTTKDLAVIYSLFLIAAIIEVGFIQTLLWISSK